MSSNGRGTKGKLKSNFENEATPHPTRFRGSPSPAKGVGRQIEWIAMSLCPSLSLAMRGNPPLPSARASGVRPSKRFSGSFRSGFAGTAPHPISIDSFSGPLYGQSVECGSWRARVVIFMRGSLFLTYCQYVRAGPPVHCQKDGHQPSGG